MVRKFQQLALPICRRRSSATRRTLGGLVAGALLVSLQFPDATAANAPAAATDRSETTGVTSLRPYSATYETTASGMSLTLERQLKTDGSGNYTLTNGGKILVAGFYEVAAFRVDNGQVQPRSYVYQGTGLINRRREVQFTPGADTLRSLYKGDWYELPYTEGTLDRMSQQEQLRLLLLNDSTPEEDVFIRIADGRKVKQYQLVFVGEEALDTPVGKVATLHFKREHDDPDRKSDMWLAPGWDYLMIKTIHIEDGKPVEVVLSSATIDGEVVADAGDH